MSLSAYKGKPGEKGVALLVVLLLVTVLSTMAIAFQVDAANKVAIVQNR